MLIKELYIDQEIIESPLAATIARRFDIPAVVVSNDRELFHRISSASDPIQHGKQILYLTRNKGAFVKKCPGTRSYNCCGYDILHIGTFCHMDCAYCILQSYFHPPLMQFFVNHNDLLAELGTIFDGSEIRRIGTGEFTDSFIWDPWTDLNPTLIPVFGNQDRAVLELKTKTADVSRLQPLVHNRKTIISWSINTPRVIRNEERRTASLAARLAAAAQCEAWGYPVAFHFDPIVIYDNCQAEYEGVIKQIFSRISAQNIVWISLGTFRFMPSLKPLVQKRFPDSTIVYGEFITGLDGKMRYFKPIRIEVYQKLVACIRRIAPGVLIYFCMEDEEVWHKCLGYTADDKGGLDRMLDQRAAALCGVSELKIED